MIDPIADFIDHMRSHDCGPDASVQIVADDKRHRYRLDGDKPKTENGSYCLKVEPDGFAVGWCMSFRDQVVHKWHTKSSRKATAEERAEWKRKRDTAAARQEKERQDAADEAAAKSAEIWKSAERSGTNDYLTKKGFTAEEIGCRMSRGSVVVPMWRDGRIVGVQFIDGDGGKRFVSGCEKTGAYHAIKGEGDLIVICEGLATGGAIHRALGCTVVVAFDAGNLGPVARVISGKYPDTRFAIAADHDAWTIPGNRRPDGFDNPAGDDPRWEEWRDLDLTVNTGRNKAIDAAGVIRGGAFVVHPPIPFDDPEKRTDFWDVMATDGIDAVKAAFARAMEPAPEPEYPPEPYFDDPEPPSETDRVIENVNPIFSAVRPLGYNDKKFYFFPKRAGQIIDFAGPSLANMQNLVTLAPLSLWNSVFNPDNDLSEKKLASMAAVALIDACMEVGVYNPDVERRVGVWMDVSGPVFNAGDRLYHSGGSCPPPEFKSDEVYIMGPRVGRLVDNHLTNTEAAELLKICCDLAWKNKISGYMLAGWIVTAIIGGALRWRSHIVVTGEKGAGKSWVIENIVKAAMGDIYLERDGGTTEAKLRRDLGGSSRPVVMDEAESETQKDRMSMEGVLMLARKSSSGASVANFDGVYTLRSSFCFAAINPRIVQGADLDRNTMLQLEKYRGADAADRFRDMEARVSKLIDDDFSERLLSRSFGMVETIMKNVETFSEVLAAQNGSKRFGDQYGTLLAGAYALTSTSEISYEAAREWCGRHDWNWAVEDNDQTDGERLLAYIMSSRVRYDDRGMAREASIGRLIDRALNGEISEAETAHAALGEYGLRADRDWLTIAAPCRPMMDILRDTAWGGSYRRTLADIIGAESRDKIRFSSTLRVRGIALPMSLVMADMAKPEDVDIPFEDFA